MTQLPSPAVEAQSIPLPSPAEFESAGLYGPRSPNAADRLELLEYLAGAAMSVEQMLELYDAFGLTGLLESSLSSWSISTSPI